MLNYYSKLSTEVYDLDKPIGSSFGDIEYYQERLRKTSGRILEPAVGTGRMLIPLLEAGYEVDGFDVSAEMLEKCRDNCRQRNLSPNLFKGRMESFSTDQQYNVIIIPTGTFLLLHEREQSLKALRNFHYHLEDGGKLIVDLYLQREIDLGKISTRTWTLENGDTITLENKKVEVDWVNQYTVSHGRYEKWREGKLIATELERFPMRWYGVEEFMMVLEQTGFKDITVSADYRYGEYPTKEGQCITFEAIAEK
ncbi:class I SAM-dependent methyltransferase [Planococcus shenhongbingii]|uniref:Class I SAM-dependent methyltransferase n=1 Tax=Planococcus shenhongbingii TaxID=3058398 RepID=A0ABT8NEC7_9BACL|nr:MULTISPECIES: class I SAM-dependent methyltransferase [unclassified Planococcus (in: firmicutes)]MDN7246186.1 class I SAM-dependent methyltransferase [Planococcus sp. N017]WKA59193.1 class I SAM-dependent methyltransferase [Planococcus sp. N016]